MINKTEALLDSISFLNKTYQGDSLAYCLRNPLLLKSYARDGKHRIDENGIRIFDSLLAGYKAGVFDLETKLSGKSNAGISSSDKLRNLLGVYGIKNEADINTVVFFLRKSLKDPEVTSLTPLTYFIK